jgi:hypothetical protein
MVPRIVAAPAAALPEDISRAIEGRLADLQRRGGACAEYGSVMERSYRQGRISIRPYMWRVEGRLVSGQASPNGDMVIARDIDPLNVGVRTLDDVLWSAEHESAHIAFRIGSLEWAGLDLADRYVRACRATVGNRESGIGNRESVDERASGVTPVVVWGSPLQRNAPFPPTTTP